MSACTHLQGWAQYCNKTRQNSSLIFSPNFAWLYPGGDMLVPSGYLDASTISHAVFPCLCCLMLRTASLKLYLRNFWNRCGSTHSSLIHLQYILFVLEEKAVNGILSLVTLSSCFTCPACNNSPVGAVANVLLFPHSTFEDSQESQRKCLFQWKQNCQTSKPDWNKCFPMMRYWWVIL